MQLPRWVPCSLLLLAGGFSSAASSQVVAPAVGTPEFVVGADPLEVGRLARRMGDDAVLSGLAATASAESRLFSVRAAPLLAAPERSLAALAEIAAGRDELLAPAAARSLLLIARSLSASDLSAREVTVADLRPAFRGLQSVADDESARGDVLRAVVLALDALHSLLVPPDP